MAKKKKIERQKMGCRLRQLVVEVRSAYVNVVDRLDKGKGARLFSF